MTTKPAPLTSNSDLLSVVRGLPGGKGLAFSGWPDSALAVVLRVAVETLADFPGAAKGDVMTIAHRVWDRARSIACGPQGLPLDVVLSREPLASGPVLQLAELLAVLMAAGDLANTLRLQRSQIDRTLDYLAALRTRPGS